MSAFKCASRSWRSVALDVEQAERTLVAVDNPIGAIELDELRRALMRLPEEQREALILIGAGVQMIGTRIMQSELTMRESFLRLEYRLAEVSEELTRRQGD